MFLYLCKSGCTEIVEGGQLIRCLFVDFNTDRGNSLAWHADGTETPSGISLVIIPLFLIA
jgi:hypothetical protein